MIEKWGGQLPNGEIVVVEEGAEFMDTGEIVQVMAPINGQNVIRVCTADEEGKLSVGKIMEEAFSIVYPYKSNGKGYADYDMEVRERMNLFTKEEKAQRRKEFAKQNRATGSGYTNKAKVTGKW